MSAMQYPVVIYKESDCHHFDAIVPDLPECKSYGDTPEDALQNIKESIELHLQTIAHGDQSLPLPTSIEKHQQQHQFKDAMWCLVMVDRNKVLGRVKRVNITLPENLISQIDQYTTNHGGNRSAFLVDAAISFLRRHHCSAD